MPFYEAAGSKIVHFGQGDIIISKAQNAEKEHKDEICLIADDRQNTPGEFIDPERWKEEFEGKGSDQIDCPIRMIFDNISGLDALICTLMELRVDMVSSGIK